MQLRIAPLLPLSAPRRCLYGDGSCSLLALLISPTHPQSSSKTLAWMKSSPAIISEQRPAVTEQPRYNYVLIGCVTAVLIASHRYGAARLARAKARGQEGMSVHGGVQGITPHPWPSPKSKGSRGKHRQHFQTQGSIPCPTPRQLPRCMGQTAAASPKIWGLRGTKRCLEPPKQGGVPMAQACCTGVVKRLSKGCNSSRCCSDLLPDLFSLKGSRWVPAEGRGLVLLCILQLQSKGLHNRARGRQQTLLTQGANTGAWKKQATLSQPRPEDLHTEARL